MYNPQTTVIRIKELSDIKAMKQKDLIQKCGLNKNTINSSANSKMGLNAKALFSISNCLHCTTDYLLGRTDTPNSYYNAGADNNAQANASGSSKKTDGLMEEFMQAFSELSFEDKVSVMQYVNEIKKSSSENGTDQR